MSVLTRRISVAALLLCAVLMAKDQGFSGKWVLDNKTSHGTEPLAELRQDIRQQGSALQIQSQFPEPANGIAPLLYLGIMTTDFKLSTDGREVVNQIGPYMVTAKSSLDGNKLTTEWRSSINGDPVQGKWVRTLSDDGKQMTLEISESSTKGQQGNATLTLRRK